MKLRKNLFALILLCTGLPAFSSVICEGNVKNVAVKNDGLVRLIATFQSSESHFTICNLESSWNSVSTNVCKYWLSQAQVAYAADKKMKFYYPDGTVCSTISSSNPKPEWLILVPDA